MKKLVALLLAVSMVFALAACGGNDNKPSDSSNTPTDTNTPAPDANTPAPDSNTPAPDSSTPAPAGPVNPDEIDDTMTSADNKYVIAMVTDVGQLKDKSFNQGTWNGVKLYASGNTLANVVGVAFHEEQCGYLAGYAAVKEGNTKLGFTGGGGGTNPAVNRYGYGFVQGAQAAAAEDGVNVEMNYSYLYGDNYSASAELQTQINGWYANGTEIVFACGGSMCNSVFAAAAANNALSIGVDVDQSGESNTVMTSAVKGLAEAASLMLGRFYDGKWDEVGGQAVNLGVDDDAVGLPFASSQFEVITEDIYNTLVDGMKTGGSLEVKGEYDTFLAGGETFANVAVNFVK